MNTKIRIAVLSVVVAIAGLADTTKDPASYVDPYIGCSYNGHCFAAACVPFGLVQAGPDTGFLWWDYCSGYRYADTKILGFSQTHISGTGCGDLGDLQLMPFTGAVDLTRTNFASAYRKETQTAQPGFYQVTLDDNHAKVSVAAAPHSAIYEIAYQGSDTPRLFVDSQFGILNWTMKTPEGRVLYCDIRQEGDRTLVGTLRTRVWVERSYSFVLEFDHAITARQELPKRSDKEKATRFVLSFDLPAGGTLRARFAISAKSVSAARKNLAAEMADWNLPRVRKAARNAWNAQLACMRAEGDDKQLKTFYTSLYHLFIQPNNLSDVGEKPFYSTLSLWDTFRAAHPLYTLIAPGKVDDFIGSILHQYDLQGYMPIWTLWGVDNQCMIGYHSIPVVVDAYLKGFRGFEAEKAYAAIRKSLTENAKGRAFNQTDTWAKYGYFPFDIVNYESVSRTLEFAYDEWCMARFAEALGKTDDVAFFDRRACNWTNVFDRSVGFARGRDSKGAWRVPFSPFKLNVGGRGTGPKDFTEGNSWQYTWHVMQDPKGLIAAMGGREKFLENLNGLFSQPEKVEGMGFALDATGLIGQYAHGNEPSHHTAYFFQYGGRGDRTAEIVREVCDKFYMPEPEGLCGNDDCGQMSAWYLFSAMGFYPFNPCGGDYVIGAPQLPRIELSLPGGRKLVVVAKDLSRENKFVQSVTFNGRKVDGFILRHADLVKGGELVFEMTNHRDALRGTPARQSRAAILSIDVLSKEPGRYIGWPTVCRRKNGELLAVFSGDRDEHVCPWGKVQLVRSRDGGRTWSAPETIRNSVADDRDAGITELADGTLVVNWFTSLAWQNLPKWSRQPYKPETRTIMAEYMRHLEKLPKEYLREAIGYWTMRSTDGGKTWEKPVRTAGTRPHNVVQLTDGRILAVGVNYPSGDHKIATDPGFDKLTYDIICEESTDGGRSWRIISKFPLGENVELKGLHEPHVTECADGRLVAMYRYEWKGEGVSLQSESADGGRTWTPLHRCGIIGYPPHLLTLKDGRLLCVYGRRTAGGFGEWACFSDDGGRTWDTENEVLLCRHWNGDLGYPASVEMDDGTIFTVYYQADKKGEKTCLMGTRWRPLPRDEMAASRRGDGFKVSKREIFVDHEKNHRSGHMGHALVDVGNGRILDFNSNVDGDRCAGHSGYGWMEYRVSTDYGRSWGTARTLPYSRRMFEEGKHTALCEKAVKAPDGRVILFFQITDTGPEICCEPWSAPTMCVSTDGGETFSDGMPTGAEAGRIYDAVVDAKGVYFLIQENEHFLGTRPEHVYKVYRSDDGGPFVPTTLPIDATGKGYGAMEVMKDGSLIAYIYDSKHEDQIEYTISRDRGKTWSVPARSRVAKLIRNPQVRRLGDRWFMAGRNGGGGDGLVLYSSCDGIVWDEGMKLDRRPPKQGNGYYSCMLPIFEPGCAPRMLLQYSHVYSANRVNIAHRVIERE